MQKLNWIQHFYHNMKYIVHPSRPDKEGKAYIIILGIWGMTVITTIPLLLYPGGLLLILFWAIGTWYMESSLTRKKRAEIAQYYQDLDQQTALTYKKRSYWALFIFILYVVAFLYIGKWLDFI